MGFLTTDMQLQADLIQQGRDDAVRRLTDLARAEAVGGDGRALRAIQRLVEAAGLGRRAAPYVDDGA